MVVGAIIFILSVYFTFTVQFVSWDFCNNLWAPAYLIRHGMSAYNINLIFNDSNSIWFPQVIGLFFFLGFLPQYPATNIWLIFNIVLLLILLGYLLRQCDNEKIKPLYFILLIVCVFLFPPTLRHLILGQVDILLIMALISGTYSIEKRYLVWGGFLFALALVKPQHCIVALPVIFMYLLFIKRAPQDSLKLFLTICFFIILQTAPLWFSGSTWVIDFLSNLQKNPNWAQPNIFSILHNRLGAIGLVIWLIVYTAIIVINFQIWSKNTPEKAILWSLASTAIISPYLWSWDFVLLLPLFIDTAIRLSNSLSKLTLFTFYAICFYGAIFALQDGTASDEVLWWFPIVLTIGITISIVVDKIMRKERVSIL